MTATLLISFTYRAFSLDCRMFNEIILRYDIGFISRPYLLLINDKSVGVFVCQHADIVTCEIKLLNIDLNSDYGMVYSNYAKY